MIVALVCWLVTAGIGFALADRWVTGPAPVTETTSGGDDVDGPRLGPGPGLVLGAHIAPAATSLLVWVAHVLTGGPVLAWIAIALLVLGAGFGTGLFVLGRRRRAAGGSRRIPRPITAHATFAGLTLVIAVLSAVL